MLRKITHDVFDICDRLKEIDRDYAVFYNDCRHRYEVHHLGQGVHTLCLVVPFCALDVRTEQLVQRTRISRLKQIIAETERHNQRLGGSMQ